MKGLSFPTVIKKIKKVGAVGDLEGEGVFGWVGGGADGDGVDVLCWVIGLWSGEERYKALGCSKRRQRKGKEKEHT